MPQCSAWDPRNQKDKAALAERIQPRAVCFVTGNYDQTASVTGVQQDPTWVTLEKMRRQARGAIQLCLYKMCHGLLDGSWEGGLFDSKQGKENMRKP